MTACNGQEALQLILNEKPDIVITDIKMPIMDGLELIKKTAELYPDTLFAVLSGYDDFDFARTALKHNAIDYLLKPCSIESIHELLKNAVDRLNEREEKKEFLQKILDDYHKLENRLEEQAFKDYIINPVTRKESLTEYAPFSSIKEQPFRLLLLHTDDASQAVCTCLLYTSDAADDLPCVDLGGPRIIKKKKTISYTHLTPAPRGCTRNQV